MLNRKVVQCSFETVHRLRVAHATQQTISGYYNLYRESFSSYWSGMLQRSDDSSQYIIIPILCV